MADYQVLKKRLDQRDTVILDGAVGGQLAAMGVPMDPVAWCGPANYTHPSSVVQMHERHIRAGADIITTNTWSTVRPTLERAGYGGLVREINARAVHLAQEARDRAAADRPIYIAGSISSNITGRNPRTGQIAFANFHDSARVPAEELVDYYEEMAGILAEAGVDFFLVEPMGSDNEARIIETQAAKDTGLPVWVGFDVHVDSDDTVILGNEDRYAGLGNLPASARPVRVDMPLAEAIAEVKPLGPDAMAVFHSRIEAMSPGLQVMLDEWSGPVVGYPDSAEASAEDRTGISEFTETAKEWVGMGVQVVGTCCGYGAEYIEPLRDALPRKIAA